jgi:hypothetical protein
MLKKLFSSIIYVKVYQNKYIIRHIEDNNEIVLSAIEPFTTRRLLIGDFSRAENLLKDGIRKIQQARWLSPAPAILVQPIIMTEDGLSEVEERIFLEVASAAGGRKVKVWVGHELSDSEVLQKYEK